jgi:hypothetical protein
MTTICSLLFFAVWAEILDYFSMSWAVAFGDGWAVAREGELRFEWVSLPVGVGLKHPKAAVFRSQRWHQVFE